MSFEAGTTLIQQGDTNHTFFVLIQGEARTPVDALVMSHDQFRAVQGSPQVLARLRTAINDRFAADRLTSG